eukprot:TRINITY_DN65052_c0_g1_i1.p1 TRINITY_DN65052_c0_g1~~TRINITY_DN65052_c0_g1_i1.p1  ORF type:complete len:457 (+),score=89.50 TRINITY_DN65052_c0_g1_i1:173-1372(+)
MSEASDSVQQKLETAEVCCVSPASQEAKPSKDSSVGPSSKRPPEHLFNSADSQLLPGLGVKPSARQVLRAEVMSQATLEDLFGTHAAAARRVAQQDAQDREETMKMRIRKMLELAFHPNTGGAESNQALRNAQKLMKTHNLNQADVLATGELRTEEGGLQGVKLTRVDHNLRMQGNHEYWTQVLMKAVELTFDVGSFNRKVKEHNANYVIFYGRYASAEIASFAYTCAFNRIAWMAGTRALPPDEFFPSGSEHSGQSFSQVLKTAPGFVEWVKSQERRKGGVGDSGDALDNFLEYARAHEDPLEWDRAYKEGVARALKKDAEASLAAEEQVEVSTALALASKAVQEQVLQRLGSKLKKKRKITGSDGGRIAPNSYVMHAAPIKLRKKQLDVEPQLHPTE